MRPALAPLPSPDDPQYSDAWIGQQVLIRLDRDPLLHPYRFHVQSREAVVWVQGAVPSEQLRQRAERIVRDCPQVKGVHNNVLVVQSGPPGH